MNAVPERIATMYDYYQRGYTLEQVGSKFHYAGMSVSRLFRDYGLPIRTPNQTRRLKAYPQTLRMYRDYQAGMSYDAIGEKYGLVGSSVWRRFKRWGLHLRSGSAQRPMGDPEMPPGQKTCTCPSAGIGGQRE